MAQRVFEVSLIVKDPLSICQNKEVNVLNNIILEEPGSAKLFERNGYFVTEWGVILK